MYSDTQLASRRRILRGGISGKFFMGMSTDCVRGKLFRNQFFHAWEVNFSRRNVQMKVWGPSGCVSGFMGAAGIAWARGALAHLWKCYNVFCALQFAKRPADELFMHYFHKLSSAFGGFAPQMPTAAPSLICPPRKKSCGRPCPNRCAVLQVSTCICYDLLHAG